MDAKTFLNTLWPNEIIRQRRLLIWTFPDKTSRFFSNVDTAVSYALKKAVDQDVYFGLSLVSGDPTGRGKFANMAAIACLWADIDLADPVHKKKLLPPDLPAAQKLLNHVGLAPSIVVNSGHGLHAYWLLKEPWTFADDADRHKAATLARRWTATIRAVAKAQGFDDIDSVGDLTRIFRLPGTFNHKDPDPAAMPLPVKIVHANPGLRYDVDDFDLVLVAEEYEPQEDQGLKMDPLILRSDAEPPPNKLIPLLENDAKFKKTWQRRRPEFPSPSEYDQSIANTTAYANWTEQEIANTIIAFRRLHDLDVTKALRRDYMQRTIGKAIKTAKHDRTIAKLAETAMQAMAEDQIITEAEAIRENRTMAEMNNKQTITILADAIKDADTEYTQNGTADATTKKALLEKLSAVLGIPILRWVQHGQENARYSLQLSDGRWVRMGTTKDVLSPDHFRSRLYEATRVLIKTTKRKTWDNVCQCLAKVVEVVENEEMTDAYQTKQWIKSYLDDHPPMKEEDWQEAASISEPFIRNDMCHIHAGELHKHMRILQHEKITHAELCDCLKVCGYARVTVFFRYGGERSTRSFWAKAIMS